jgi:formylglycine-generating enzyme required for sulfatase activity
MLPPLSVGSAVEIAERQLEDVASGEIVLRDEPRRKKWRVGVRPFRLSRYPVTRDLYKSLIDVASPGAYARVPVTDVSWNDAVAFCNALSAAAGLQSCYAITGAASAEDVTCDFDARGYRLPTEAEWEHACRAGSTAVRYGGLDEIAWYKDNSGGTLHEVGGKQPNEWGFHDMIGNAWEWCWDIYDADVYGPYRVFRGGGYADLPRGCRASCRRKSHPMFAMEDVGFRLAKSA